MNQAEKRSLIAIPLVILVAAGLALAGGQDSVKVFGMPVYALGILLAILIQWAAFVPAYLRRTEKFYDLTGSITYISVTAAAVLLSPFDGRSLLLLGMVTVWALRLGTFLYKRIHAAGEDRRFQAQ